MKNNNNARESIPCFTCGVALMPMKEVYQKMSEDFAEVENALANANSSKTIRHILQEIYEYPVDTRVSEQIRHMIADIKGCVRAMHTHDYTRLQMQSALSVLLIALQDAILQEERNEDIESVRRTLLFMADHAEEFVDWVEEMHKKQ